MNRRRLDKRFPDGNEEEQWLIQDFGVGVG